MASLAAITPTVGRDAYTSAKAPSSPSLDPWRANSPTSAYVSTHWPGAVRTERIARLLEPCPVRARSLPTAPRRGRACGGRRGGGVPGGRRVPHADRTDHRDTRRSVRLTNHAMNRTSQLMCAHSGLLFVLLLGVGVFAIAGWLPPHDQAGPRPRSCASSRPTGRGYASASRSSRSAPCSGGPSRP